MYKENKDSKTNFSSEKIKCNEKLHYSRKNKIYHVNLYLEIFFGMRVNKK